MLEQTLLQGRQRQAGMVWAAGAGQAGKESGTHSLMLVLWMQGPGSPLRSGWILARREPCCRCPGTTVFRGKNRQCRGAGWERGDGSSGCSMPPVTPAFSPLPHRPCEVWGGGPAAPSAHSQAPEEHRQGELCPDLT